MLCLLLEILLFRFVGVERPKRVVSTGNVINQFGVGVGIMYELCWSCGWKLPYFGMLNI
jgi:hypothetical protein